MQIILHTQPLGNQITLLRSQHDQHQRMQVGDQGLVSEIARSVIHVLKFTGEDIRLTLPLKPNRAACSCVK